MALAASEITALKRYLGYTLTETTVVDTRLGELDADGETAVSGALTELSSLDTAITAARGRLKAQQVGDLVLNGRQEIAALRRERSTVIRELGRMLGVCPMGHTGEVIV